MRALDRKLVRDLLHLKSQVLAIALVVACGMATYVTLNSAYRALVTSQASYYRDYRFADVFAEVKQAPESLAAQMASIPGVARLETRIVKEVTLDVRGLNEPATGRVVSIPVVRAPILNDLHIRRGRYVEPGPRDEVLVSEAFANANKLAIGETLGAVINGRWERLRIVGIALSPEYVYEIREGDVFPDNRRFGVLWMNRKVLGASFDMEGAFNDVALSLAPGASEADVIARLDLLLERYGGLGAYGRRDQLSNRFLTDEIAQDRTHGTIVPAIFLGVAAFLIHMVLSRLVSTQRSQIALLKAFGYKSSTIGSHFLEFALVAAAIGTALGTWLGVWLGTGLAKLYALYFHFPVLDFRVGLRLIGLTVAISGGSACLGALSAVRAAVKLPPAEGMQPESPARYTRGLLENAGLSRLLSLSARMIVRNLERRPLKALLSAAGIAFAVAILLVGRYFFDAVDYIKKVQFRTVQREDVTVLLNGPRSSGARDEFKRLPAVLGSEPFREVPVRLRFEHRSRRVTLLGLDPAGQLRRLVDERLKSVDLPQDGLVLTAKLAQVLGVSPGQTVTVEVLEGDRLVRQIPVRGLVDELIGVSAYMDVRALNRLMREGASVSGTFLSVDSLGAPRLYGLLKRTPVVMGVSVREAMLASFEETVARSLNASTMVLIIFACTIACGVVYNGARVSLSERGTELASLRVLGFSRGEVAAMLLGEQTAITLFAVPFGFAIGFAICMWSAHAMESELYRMPLIITGRSYAFAFLVVAAAACLSGLLILRRIRRLDLVAVLKSRE